MCDSEKETESDSAQSATGDAWREVGEQFEALGHSLASAFRAAWESEESRQHVRQLQSGLESMVNQVHAAVVEGAASPEAKQARMDIEKALGHAHAALLQAGAELQNLLSRLAKPATGKDQAADRNRRR